MFFLKDIYVLFNIVFLLLNGFFLVKNLLKKGDLSKSVNYVFIACMLAVIPYNLSFIISNQKVAEIVIGLYLADLDFSLFMILLCIYNMESRDTNTKSIRFFRYLYMAIAFADSLLLISNFYTGWIFYLVPYSIDGRFYCWRPRATDYFHIHIMLCCLMALTNVYRMLKDAFIENKIYRGKFIPILCFFVLVFTLNQLYLGFPQLLLDISLPVYGYCAVFLYHVTYYMVPSSVKKNLLSIASESISEAVFCYDFNNVCIYKNQVARNLEPLIDSSLFENCHKGDKDFFVSSETFILDGILHIFDVEFRRIRDGNNNLNGSYIRLKDRTDELREMEQEQYRATHDELTGLYNRAFFFSEVERLLKEDPDTPRYMVATDIRDFKLFNDLFGSTYGDNVLKKQAEMLKRANYAGCVIGRISGDKFGMCIAKSDFNPELAVKNTGYIREYTTDINFRLIITIGVYEIANTFENVHKMYDKANLACRNVQDLNHPITMYDTSLMKRIIDEKNIVSEFKSSLDNDQFCMFLQPQISSKDGKCVGAEALVRWYDIEKGYRSPSIFIHILEKSGLIYQLDHYIWEKAAQKLSVYRDTDFYISVNISVKDFYYADLYLVFTGLVEKYDISPSKLKLEITESVLMGNDKSYRNVLTRLREFGFVIEMDDFGSGYSSLNALKELDMDVLKIDMEFLKQTENEARGNIIVASIVKMAKALGMSVVCEGVETAQQAEFLTEVGVDLFQGFFYSKPIPAEEFEHKYLEAKK